MVAGIALQVAYALLSEGASMGNTPITLNGGELVLSNYRASAITANSVTWENEGSQVTWERVKPSDSGEKCFKRTSQDDASTCVICLDASPEIAFNPRGHLCACAGCAGSVTDCPICRRHVSKRLRIYAS